MNDGNGNPPIDIGSAIPLGEDGKVPIPTAVNCIANVVNQKTPPSQVSAMALVGILHQLEVRNELEVGKLQEVRDALAELSDATDAGFAELWSSAKDAAGFSAVLLEKADTYRDRLESLEREVLANQLELHGSVVLAFDEIQSVLEHLVVRVLRIEDSKDPPTVPAEFDRYLDRMP